MGTNSKTYRKFEKLESVIFSVFVSEWLDLATEAITYPTPYKEWNSWISKTVNLIFLRFCISIIYTNRHEA